jgi:hypothetical protein
MPTSKSKNNILGLKIKTVDYNKPNYLGHPTSCLDSHLTAAVQHITQLAQIDEMSQPHTVQIIWCIPVVVDIPIYRRDIIQLAHPIFTQIYDNAPFTIQIFR